MGINMGKLVEIEERGRILIPKEIRKRLNLKPGKRLVIDTQDSKIIIVPAMQKEMFIAELNGCVRGSKIGPLEMKKMWEKL